MPLFVVRVTEVNEALQHMQRVVDAVALTELARTAHVVEFGIFQQDADVVVVAETFEQLAEGNVVETDQPFGPAETPHIGQARPHEAAVGGHDGRLVGLQHEPLRSVAARRNLDRPLHQRRLERRTVVVVGIDVEGRTEHPHVVLPGLDDKRLALIVRHLEIALAAERHPTRTPSERRRILQPALRIEPHLRTVGEPQLDTLSGGNDHLLHPPVGNHAAREEDSREADQQQDAGRRTAHAPCRQPSPERGTARRPSSGMEQQCAPQPPLFEVEAVIFGRSLRPLHDPPLLVGGRVAVEIAI